MLAKQWNERIVFSYIRFIKNIFIITILFFFAACKKDVSIWKISNLNTNKISVIGHGGMGIYYRWSMNSYESLSACLQKNVEGLEMDVNLSKDGELILHKGDMVICTKDSNDGWFYGYQKNNQQNKGWFPASYTKKK